MLGAMRDFCRASDNIASLKSAAARMDRLRHSRSSRSNALRLITLFLLASTPEAVPLGPPPPASPLSGLTHRALDTPRFVLDNIGHECFTTYKYFHFAFIAGNYIAGALRYSF